MKFRSIFQSKDVKKVCKSAFNIMGVSGLPRDLAREVASGYVRSMVRNGDTPYVSTIMEKEMDRIQAEKDLAVVNQMF